jgi:hypothetical protein
MHPAWPAFAAATGRPQPSYGLIAAHTHTPTVCSISVAPLAHPQSSMTNAKTLLAPALSGGLVLRPDRGLHLSAVGTGHMLKIIIRQNRGASATLTKEVEVYRE